MKVTILGTEYTIETHKISEDAIMKERQLAGYCGEESKLIVIADTTEKEFFPDMDAQEQQVFRKKTLRHEIIHAFLSESGLSENSSVPERGWAKHEEMIDWLAHQYPKMLRAFQEADCI